jgi:hypothetical protein
LSGDKNDAKRALPTLLSVLVKADTDVPVLRQANAEYAKLKWSVLSPAEPDGQRSPAIDGQLICIERVGTTSGVRAVDLEVNEKVSQRPAKLA